MKLIIEAGATKSDWAIIDEHSIINHWKGFGINPTSNIGSEKLLENEILSAYKIEEVHYYGAGINSESSQTLIKKGLSSLFSNEPNIMIQSDLVGAARSVWQEGKFIVGILGTGSNVGLFEGNHFIESIPSPGYLFGDEGSGFNIGQSILKAYFMDTMDVMSRLQFEMLYGKDKLNLRSLIYKSAKPNYEIAKYAQFLNKSAEEFKERILQKCFEEFVIHKLSKINSGTDYNVNFVGSIAKVFETKLIKVLESHSYKVNKIIDSPLNGIIKFHQKYG